MIAARDNDRVRDILARAVAGERLTPAQGLELLDSHDLLALGRAAHAVCERLHLSLIHI